MDKILEELEEIREMLDVDASVDTYDLNYTIAAAENRLSTAIWKLRTLAAKIHSDKLNERYRETD